MSFANPYAGLPDQAFWKRAVAGVAPDQLDPVVKVPFKLKRADRLATAGSCFSQHIAKQLRRRGFGYYDVETPHPIVPAGIASAHGFGLFSARYGNVYTAAQLLQLFGRAFGSFSSAEDHWIGHRGEYLDPFRPTIQPDGYVGIEDLRHDRDTHLSRVQHLFRTLDVMIFTMGLTEAWERRDDGTVLPICPAVVAADRDEAHYSFANHSIDRVRKDLFGFIEALRSVNPGCRIILSVSPVAMIATYAGAHVLSANTYSKSILRVAAAEAAERYPLVAYFPSYEIIAGHYHKGAYLQEDLRSVAPAGVAHVMRCFFRNFAEDEGPGNVASPIETGRAVREHEEFTRISRHASKVMCDEELLEVARAESSSSC